MGFFVKTNELFEDAGEYLGERIGAAKAVKGVMCKLYSLYPDRFTGAQNPATSFQRGYMRSLCRDELPPPPEQLPECQQVFQVWGTYTVHIDSTGGQNCGEPGFWRCCGNFYDEFQERVPYVFEDQYYLNDDTGEPRFVFPANQSIYDQKFIGCPPSGAIRQIDRTLRCSRIGNNGYDLTYVTHTPIREIPAYCDDGGRREPTFPPPQIVEPVTVVFGDDNSVRSNVTVNTTNNEFNFPTSLKLGDLSVNLDLGGITFGSGDGSEVDEGGDNTSPQPTKKPRKKPNDTDFKVVTQEDEEGEEAIEEVEVQSEEVDWVLVEIVEEPHNGKTIIQKSEENNTYFAGYFSWVLEVENAYRLEEVPIRKKYQAFEAPENISGYRVYSVNGAKLRVTQYTQIIEEESNG